MPFLPLDNFDYAMLSIIISGLIFIAATCFGMCCCQRLTIKIFDEITPKWCDRAIGNYPPPTPSPV